MTATERALLAEAKRHDEAIQGAYNIDEAIVWLRTNLPALLEGYSQALDEVEAGNEAIALRDQAFDKLQERFDHDSKTLVHWHNEAIRLRTDLAETKLVLEQQDRDMERMRAALRELRFDVVRDLDCCNYVDRIDAILNPETPCTTTK